ncbi:hypothetical protein [Streptomyces sp. NRRL S-350]|uniref:hypothetical protein n=1 Tax=Streptomyces sp. NRRL S-350 TaxID=1463902 RepID=UPI0004C167EB|nr:hypothetical protein [Streptomyces sp. NRRL S-350]
MNAWINLNALWKIVVVGLLAGAGLPALFAVGVRALNPPTRPGGPAGARPAAGRPAAGRPAGTGPAGERPAVGPGGRAVAAACFAVVLAAIGWGIFVIVQHS